MGGQTGERKGHRVKKQEEGWEAAERKEGPWSQGRKKIGMVAAEHTMRRTRDQRWCVVDS